MSKSTTPTTLTIEVPGDAVSFGTKSTVFHRNGSLVRGTRKTDAAADWEADVRRYAAEAHNGPLLEGPIRVHWVAIFMLPRSKWRKREPRRREWKTTKPDKDKIERLILDALAGVVYAHDAQVAMCSGLKILGAQGEPAKTYIEVHELGADNPWLHVERPGCVDVMSQELADAVDDYKYRTWKPRP